VRDPSISRFGAARLSPERRAADLKRLRQERFDVLVVGGGVTGAGAAVDAASRGLRVALIEARDLAAGTSSRSSKLVHGGLRYLEQFDLGLVHEALQERGLLATRLAPHLVRPMPFLLPLPRRRWRSIIERGYYGAGVALYDAFAGLVAGERGMPLHRHLGPRAARRLFPSLREETVGGAIRYHDAQVDDARLVVTLCRTAASLGAAVVTSARATSFLRVAREVTGVRVQDVETGESFDVAARTVIAATGVWSDDITEMLAEGGGPVRTGLRVRASKGVHLVVPRAAITGDAGLILRTEKSVLFIIPWGGHWIIGTTDTDWQLDRAHPAASAKDIDYLLAHANQVLDRPLSVRDIEGVYAGLRPLLRGEDDSTSALSRTHAVVEPMLGLMLVAGGKLTTYRVMAADVVDRAVRRLATDGLGMVGQGGTAPATDVQATGNQPRSRTAQLPLVGADGYDRMWRERAGLARRHGVSAGVVEHLLERYGSATVELLDLVRLNPELGQPLRGAPDYLAAEIAYAVTAEGALHVEDALARRTRISIETTHRGAETAEHAAVIMGNVLGWSGVRRRREIEHYLAGVEAERESQSMPDDLTADAARLGAPDVRHRTVGSGQGS
jgi:glycerol-3-phosphate dehydrogenase